MSLDAVDPVRPTIYLTNWSSRYKRGPGRALTIMARPRAWEHGDGSVFVLTPLVQWLDDVRAGRITDQEYRTLYTRNLTGYLRSHGGGGGLAPGELDIIVDKKLGDVVRHGDTLLCACSCAAAAANRCHRAWAAPVLVDAGWNVILDGVEYTPPKL